MQKLNFKILFWKLQATATYKTLFNFLIRVFLFVTLLWQLSLANRIKSLKAIKTKFCCIAVHRVSGFNWLASYSK